MVYYLIVCRSLTYAQRTQAAVLARAGLSPKRVFILASDGSYKEVQL